MVLMNRATLGRGRLNFTRYTAASAIATTITQIVLLACSLLGDVPALTASTVAFAAGAVPQFLIIRRWAFGRLPRQVVSFVVVTLITGAASVAMVAMVDMVIGPAVTDDDAMRALALNVGYLVGGAPIFVAKFLVFDRIFFAGRPALRSVRGGQLDQGARREAGRPRRDVVVSLVRPRRAGDVQVGPRQAGGELAQERGGHDPAGPRRALAHVGDVAGHRVGELDGEAVDVVGQRHPPPRLARPFAG
jgi:putative flippase GtrA